MFTHKTNTLRFRKQLVTLGYKQDVNSGPLDQSPVSLSLHLDHDLHPLSAFSPFVERPAKSPVQVALCWRWQLHNAGLSPALDVTTKGCEQTVVSDKQRMRMGWLFALKCYALQNDWDPWCLLVILVHLCSLRLKELTLAGSFKDGGNLNNFARFLNCSFTEKCMWRGERMDKKLLIKFDVILL